MDSNFLRNWIYQDWITLDDIGFWNEPEKYSSLKLVPGMCHLKRKCPVIRKSDTELLVRILNFQLGRVWHYRGLTCNFVFLTKLQGKQKYNFALSLGSRGVNGLKLQFLQEYKDNGNFWGDIFTQMISTDCCIVMQ